MRDEFDAILDDLLSRWHAWCHGFDMGAVAVAGVFRDAMRAKGEQTLAAISEDAYWAGVFEALDFHVDELGEPHRTAIHLNARNLYTGRKVWRSDRLPADPLACATVVAEARIRLTRRLVEAGLM